ncbi:MAG: STAS domain-containing protein [Treponema sp.]|jgi:anti-sigma B factor antagonist|nr:STAS domain-containing protein [Treponema sp.]
MDIKIRTNQHIYIIDVEGSMDLYYSNQLKELVMKMIEKKVERFIINVNNVKSIDSSGIGALIFISSTMKKMKLGLAITNVQGPVRQVMEKIKLAAYFPLYENINEAIKELSARPALESALV